MVTCCNLCSHDDSPLVNQPKYRSMIESLIYLIGIRPHIVHAIGIVGWFQENPKATHLHVVKIILNYLQGTQYYGLWYPKHVDFSLHTYTDADWA